MKLPYVQSGVQAQRWRFPLSRLPLGALCGWFREAEIYEASLCTKQGTSAALTLSTKQVAAWSLCMSGSGRQYLEGVIRCRKKPASEVRALTAALPMLA